ncbi:MAG: 4Fe-4S binding protein [Candidatus Eremiobacteraeota bacterium]|nr:4Fe-4S binding protein [Candidatus Eremiobacteraeota bacterium]
MKNKIDYILNILTIVIIIFSIHTLYVLRKPPEKKSKNGISGISMEHAIKIFPTASSLIHPKKDKEWTIILDNRGKHVGSAVVSSPHADDITGYAGSTPLIIGIDMEGIIIDIVLIENQETPGFVERVIKTEYLDRWDGRHWKKITTIEVDAVSGATLTSTSIKNTLYKRISLIDPKSVAAAPKPVILFTWKDIGIILIPIFGLFLCFGKSKHQKILRYTLMGLTIIFMGFLTASCFSITLASSWIIAGKPTSASIGMLFLVFIAIAMPMFTGRNFYCFFVCPFGALQEALYKIIPWKIKLSPGLVKNLRYIRYGILLLITLTLLLGIKLDLNNLEPFSAFMIKSAGIAAISIAIISLILSSFINRPWCSFGCSSGAFLDILKKPASSGAAKKKDLSINKSC